MYILEGNAGAGKSTFLKLAAQHIDGLEVKLEPLHNWQSTVYGQSLLADFYKNPKRWAYTLETLTLICRVKDHLQEQVAANPLRIAERSIYSGYYCFAQNGYTTGYLSDTEWRIYNEWFDFLVPGKCRAPLGFIYLNVDPTVAYERIKKRNRLAEKEITLDYLKKIDEHHRAFLTKKKNVLAELVDVPVLELDCNEEFESNPMQLAAHLTRVQDFLHATCSQLISTPVQHHQALATQPKKQHHAD